MGIQLSGGRYQDLYGEVAKLTKKALEIGRQLGQPKGYPFDPKRLAGVLKTLNVQLGLVLEGRFGEMVSLSPNRIHVFDLNLKGYQVVEDVDSTEFEFSDLTFRTFLREEDGGDINGDTLRTRAVELRGNQGLNDGLRLFGQLSLLEKCPVELVGKMIVLTGTILCRPDGGLYVPYLECFEEGVDGEHWFLDLICFHDNWNDKVLLACLE